MSYRILIASLVLTGIVLAGPRDARADLKIVATVPSLGSLAQELGGAHVSVIALSVPTQDPHFVDAKPSLALHIMRADLLLAVGLELEIGWLPTLQVGARNPKVQVGARGYLECAQFARLREIPTEKVDRAQGDIHPGGNPHYLFDPRQAAAVATGIAERMIELDRANEATYRANLKSFLAKLDAARLRWEKRLEKARGQGIVTYHKSWNYLIDWLGLVEVATLEPKPGIPPTSKHVAEVLVLARQKAVKVILQESYYPASTSELLARKIPAKLVKLPGGADCKGRESYIDHMDHVVDALAAGFGLLP